MTSAAFTPLAPPHQRLKSAPIIPFPPSGPNHTSSRPSSPSAGVRPATLLTRATSPPAPRSRTLSPHPSRRASPPSDKATAAFVRRILCGHHGALSSNAGGPVSGVSAQLPPLTSSNAVDLELYALLASLVRDYIQPWYSRITPDRAFLDELVLIVAHASRAVEERARRVDWTLLLLDTVPNLLSAHVDAYRVAYCTGFSDAAKNDAAYTRKVFHTLRPHPAFESAEADQAYRHTLASALLSKLLPYDDAENPCLRSFVDAMFADLLLGSILARLCEPVFVFGAVQRAAENIQTHTGVAPWARLDDSEKAQPGEVEQTHTGGLAQAVDPSREHINESDRLTRHGLVPMPSLSEPDPIHVTPPPTPGLLAPVTTALHYLTLICTSIYTIITTLVAASSLPSRTTPRAKPAHSSLKPLYAYALLPLFVHLLCLPDRLPWLPTLLTLLSRAETTPIPPLTPGLLGFNGRIDRLLAHHLAATTADPPLVPRILNLLRTAIFPATPAPPALPDAVKPGREEARRAAACALLNCMPRQAAVLLFGPVPAAAEVEGGGDELEALVENAASRVLDPFATDADVTRCLVYGVLEVVVGALVPEMARRAGGVVDGGRGGEGEGL